MNEQKWKWSCGYFVKKPCFGMGRIKLGTNCVEGWNGFDIHLLRGSRMGLNALWPKKSCSLNCPLSAINCFEGTFQPITLTAMVEIYLKCGIFPWFCLFCPNIHMSYWAKTNASNTITLIIIWRFDTDDYNNIDTDDDDDDDYLLRRRHHQTQASRWENCRARTLS